MRTWLLASFPPGCQQHLDRPGSPAPGLQARAPAAGLLVSGGDHRRLISGHSGVLGLAISAGQARAVLGHAPVGQRGTLGQLIHAASAAGLNGAFVLAGLLGIAGGIVAILTMRSPAAPPQPAASQPTEPATSSSRTS